MVGLLPRNRQGRRCRIIRGMERRKRGRPEMNNGIRKIVMAAAAVLMVGGNGAARAGEAPARLAVYVNGVLEFACRAPRA